MKSEKELKEKMEGILADSRLHYKAATIVENAPLAFIQFQMETELQTLSWVLGIPNPIIKRSK